MLLDAVISLITSWSGFGSRVWDGDVLWLSSSFPSDSCALSLISEMLAVSDDELMSLNLMLISNLMLIPGGVVDALELGSMSMSMSYLMWALNLVSVEDDTMRLDLTFWLF